MKKIVIASMISLASLYANNTVDLLKGNEKLACEAILCLSSGSRPSECAPSIRKYFSINMSKPHKTIKARLNFLNLCPVGSIGLTDTNFQNLKNSISKINEPCTEDNLNRTVKSFSMDLRGYGYKIDNTLTPSCNLLMNNGYTYFKPKYTCNPNILYKEADWKRGYTLEAVSLDEYNLLSTNDREKLPATTYLGYKNSYNYFKKVPINKKCWILEI